MTPVTLGGLYLVPETRSLLVIMRRIVVSFLLCTWSALPVGFAATPGEIAIGEILPEAMLRGLNGPSRKLSDFRGRPLIINVWASWCGPCRAEMASLERLAWLEEFGYLTVIGVSTDDYSERAEALLEASNATISHFIDTRLRIENLLGASHLPLTVLVDADGRVIEKVVGARQWDGQDALNLISDALGRHEMQLQPARTASKNDDVGRQR